MNQLKGIFPAVLTPFTENLEVDYEVWKVYLEFLENARVGGLFLFGTNGEGLLLELEEKKKLLKIAVETIGDRLPILVQVGSMNFQEIRSLVEYAKALEVSGIVAIAHFYYKLSDDVLIRFFKTIAEIAYPSPFFVYNIPRYTGNSVSVNIMKKLKDITPNLMGIKDSERSLEKLLQYKFSIGQEFTVMSGTDALIVPSALLGIDGTVSAIADALPELCNAAFSFSIKGNIEKAKQMQRDILKVREISKSVSDSRSALKYILVKRKIFSNCYVRFPLISLSDEEKKKIDSQITSYF
jgi:dihydrodipicolinate synthase/N-acetylneuraminate lyase